MPMIDKKTRTKARRLLRKQKQLAGEVTVQADKQVEKLVINRFSRLRNVRRFVVSWTLLILMLGLGALWQVRSMDRFYLTTAPVGGGIYREGILGSFTNANPLFATGPVDVSISRLLFSGLFKVSPSGEVMGDLASSVTADEKGLVYTVALRPDALWHDGRKVTADDVVFTYAAIQNSEVKSPLRSSWLGVKVSKVDDTTVTFTLPSQLSSFKYELTNGIVPKHILEELDPEDYRSSNFNTVELVGTGQFKYKKLQVVGNTVEDRQEIIVLLRNDSFYGTLPQIDGVEVHTYRSEESMIKQFDKQIIQSMVGLTTVPDTLTDNENIKIITEPLASTVMIFLKNTSDFLSDKRVRQALVHGTNTDSIRSSLNFSTISTDSLFLRNQFTYDPAVTQLSYDLARAKELLDGAGWLLDEASGIRKKDGQELRIRFVSQSLSEYASITQQVQEQWRNLGVQVEAILQPEEDIQTGAIGRHDYDVLLYGISIGFDPDIFAYWHSSQFDPNSLTRLNLSEYKNDKADEALEGGRTRLDQDLRKIKYKPLLEIWREDAPAIALYQPRFILVVQGAFEDYHGGMFRTAVDRYWSIADWKIRNDQVVK